MRKIKLSEVKDVLKDSATYHGREDLYFSNIAAAGKTDHESLDWINSTMKNKEEYLLSTKASFIICDDELNIPETVLTSKTIIKIESPKMGFSKIATALLKEKNIEGVHKSAVIYPGAIIGKNVTIGPNTVIYGCVEIADNVLVGANNTLGADGFGYEKDKQGKLFKFPHFGKVIIGENVEIGNNTCIDRGALLDTVIGSGTKIDNLVHIAHNVNIGKDCCIIANSVIAGSVKVDDRSWVAPNAVIREHLTVGKDALIGLGAIVTKSVDDNEVIAGFPAIPFNKMIKIFKNLLRQS